MNIFKWREHLNFQSAMKISLKRLTKTAIKNKLKNAFYTWRGEKNIKNRIIESQSQGILKTQ